MCILSPDQPLASRAASLPGLARQQLALDALAGVPVSHLAKDQHVSPSSSTGNSTRPMTLWRAPSPHPRPIRRNCCTGCPSPSPGFTNSSWA